LCRKRVAVSRAFLDTLVGMLVGWHILAAILLGLAIAAAVGREADRPRCRRCGYDRSGAGDEGLRCPECGHQAASRVEWYRRRRWPRSAILAGVAALVVGLAPHRAELRIWSIKTFLPRYQEIARGTAAGTTILIEHDTWNDLGLPEWFGPDRLVAILGNGSRQLIAAEPHIEIGPSRTRPGTPTTALPPDDSPGFGGDIDGDGEADLVVSVPTMGSGGYVTTTIYSFDRSSLRPRLVLENMWFEDIDRDGAFELAGFDGSFAYVFTSNAGSTRPPLRFRIERGRPVIDAEAMRSLAPSAAELDALRDAVRAGPTGEGSSREAWLAPLLRGTILLLYAGRAADARDFLRGGWRGSEAERIDLEARFRETFESSPWAHAIRELSTTTPPWP
jgi:hypothetical protein